MSVKQIPMYVCVGFLMVSSQSFASECGASASHPDDPYRKYPGVEREDINLAEAIQVCKLELSVDDDNARLNYHLGRVLFYSDRQSEAMPYLEKSVESGYPQSIFVLGYVHATSGTDGGFCRAFEYWEKALAQEHPWSAYFATMHYMRGDFEECDVSVSLTMLESYMSVAEDNITVSASAGRLEELRAKLNAYRKERE